jgi:hypothetical protein
MRRNLYTILDVGQALLFVQKDGTSVKEPRQNEKGQVEKAKGRPANRIGLS